MADPADPVHSDSAEAGSPGHGPRRVLVRGFEAARADGDVVAMAEAARRLAGDRRFGAPAVSAGYLHETYERTVASGPLRLRALLAVELARVWGYANEFERAAPFAADALEVAERLGDPAILAAALDADLLGRWGPDDLPDRVAVAARLDGLAGRLTDVEGRLSAALWRLTTGLEMLDVVAVHRQLRVLDDLERESGSARVQMFSASRHGMQALLVGDVAAAHSCLDTVRTAARASGEPDGEALVHVLASGIARQEADREALRREAIDYETFGTTQGIRSVTAEACVLWLEAGEPDRAAELLEQVAPGGLAQVPRDVDWLLVVTSVAEVAAGVGLPGLLREAVEELTPYTGRGVVNAGGVAFVGVVDHILAIACAALGLEREAARHTAAAATGYRRLGATWWSQRLQKRDLTTHGTSNSPPPTASAASPDTIMLVPEGDDVWLVGPADRASIVKGVKGFRYLRLLLARPAVPLTAPALVAAVNGTSGKAILQDAMGELLDRRALTEYRRRLGQLDEMLDDAQHAGDHHRLEQIATEREFLLDELASATGMGGRVRRSGGDNERARVAVRKAIATAIARIADADAATGRLLTDTVRTGATCVYNPDPARPVEWILDSTSGTAG
ncbi:hypothetical protein [Kineosporia sp. R_H_3]|uniref:hypothetical protein n=1 Tax=Kineosporia sp. R_H_3 TaxID=1961848 RepID=UPI00117B4582|nr:hypothetical protein [Kineosporia sp. R_H_3]